MRVAGRGVIATVMALASAASFVAYAQAVSPEAGSTSGGTAVTIDAPQFEFVQVNEGKTLSVGLTRDNQLYAWGANLSSVPVPVDQSGVLAGKTITDLAVGANGTYALVLASDGTVAGWGTNDQGQLGNGTTSSTYSTVPVAVDTTGALAGKTIVSIAAGSGTSLAIADDGTAYTWGDNASGMLGAGLDGTAMMTSPVAVDTSGVLDGVTLVRGAVTDMSAAVVSADGRLFTWGADDYGLLGDDGAHRTATGRTFSAVPVEADTSQAPDGTTFSEVTAGMWTMTALTTDGDVYGWGNGRTGQLGTGSATNWQLPTPITSGALADATVASVDSGGLYTLALLSDGSMVGWGANGNQQIATGSTDVVVPTTMDLSALGGAAVIDFAAGTAVLVATDAHSTWSWGAGGAGQLGDGTSIDSQFPVAVVLPTDKVTFGGVSATEISRIDADTISAVTPPHAAGTVDVRVTIGNRVLVFAQSYTYGTAPTVTDPADTTSPAGSEVALSVTATGDDLPAVSWQTSTTGTDGWTSAPGATQIDNGDGTVTSTLVVTAGAEGTVVHCRAVAANAVDQVISASAAVTATAAAVSPDPTAEPTSVATAPAAEQTVSPAPDPTATAEPVEDATPESSARPDQEPTSDPDATGPEATGPAPAASEDPSPEPSTNPTPTAGPSADPTGTTPTDDSAGIVGTDDPAGAAGPAGAGGTAEADSGEQARPATTSTVVTDAQVRSVLAHTGSDPSWLFAGAGVLLLAGAVFVLAGRSAGPHPTRH